MCHTRAVMHDVIAYPHRRGKTFLALPVHAQPAILPIWQEAHMEKMEGAATLHNG